MSRYFFAMPSDCEWPFDKRKEAEHGPRVTFELPHHIADVIDATIAKQKAETGTAWTRDECCRRWVCEMARMTRDGGAK